MFMPFSYRKSSLRPFNSMSQVVKESRMHSILFNLQHGYALEVDELYFEEVKFLKVEYGDDLIKSQGRIYLVNLI